VKGGTIVAFGGADREQIHFQDLLVFSGSKDNSLFERQITKGDVPMPRSGHSVVSYGKFVFLFGGLSIDEGEQKVYNDMYMLDTETWEWGYVGEAGVEIPPRNSHSMAILTNPVDQESYVVIYGGASPDLGPLGDTYYALLPSSPSLIGQFLTIFTSLTILIL
jgi:hypothetical protein